MFTNFRRYTLTHNSQLESNFGKSVTVPDMSIPLRTLIDRHLSGGSVKTLPGKFLPDNTSIPLDLERMDAVDKAQLLKSLPDFIATSRGKLISRKQAREAAAREAAAAAAAAAASDSKPTPEAS